MAQSLASVLPIRPQAALSPADEAWAPRVAAMAYRFGIASRGVRGMLAVFPSGLPSGSEAAVMAEMAAIAGAA